MDLVVAQRAADVILDVRGLSCPLPVLKVRKMMRRVEPGSILAVLATDPGAEQDLRDYCAASGDSFLATEPGEEGAIKILIRKL